VGGIGIAPGPIFRQRSDVRGNAWHCAEVCGKDYVNPGSIILSAEMMLRHMGWIEAADLIVKSMERAIDAKNVTYDFARLMPGATRFPVRHSDRR